MQPSPSAPRPTMVGEAHAHVQGASLKACAVFLLRLLNSPITRELIQVNRAIVSITFGAFVVAGTATAKVSHHHGATMQRAARPMEFSRCKSFLTSAAVQTGMPIKVAVDGPDTFILRFRTSDGSVLGSCFRQTNEMVLLTSPYR